MADTNMADMSMAAIGKNNMVAVLENKMVDANMAANMGGLNMAAGSNMATASKMAAGPRPFPCPICGRSFASGAGLRRHQRRHSPAPSGTA
ncbi:ZN497 protein, partial [Picathartes gymnocephalus]|nr:ZN497 protein [Picathartes gymnocephalus]